MQLGQRRQADGQRIFDITHEKDEIMDLSI